MVRARGGWRVVALVMTLVVVGGGVAPVVAGPDYVGGYWAGAPGREGPATLPGGLVVHTAGLAALMRQGAVLVDVSAAPRRPAGMAAGAPWLPLPHRAIAGSVWLPGVGQAVVDAGVGRAYVERLRGLTGGDRDRPVVVYCHVRCWMSWNAARRAIEAGYRRVLWDPDGIEGWVAAGHEAVVVER